MYVSLRTHCRIFDEDYSGFVPEGDLRPLGVEDSTTSLGGTIEAKMRILKLFSGREGEWSDDSRRNSTTLACPAIVDDLKV